MKKVQTTKKRKQVLGVIPARLKSTRLANKMLELIDGQPLIYHTWRQAQKAKMLDDLIIATDAKEIYDLAVGFGAKVMMTPTMINSGSDRVAYAAKKYKEFVPKVVVNIQGDEPLMPPKAIDDAVKALLNSKDKNIVVSTPATPFLNQADLPTPNFVKVVTDKNNKALYFSRSVLPFPRDPYNNYYKHLGLYVYRRDFLIKYPTLKQTPLELAEKLEQLRIMENGYGIVVVKGNYPTMEVNTKEELERAREMIESKKSKGKK